MGVGPRVDPADSRLFWHLSLLTCSELGVHSEGWLWLRSAIPGCMPL